METYRGQGIGDGVCIGCALVVLPKTYSNEDGATAAWSGEKGWAAFEAARQRAVEALEKLAKSSRQSLGSEQAEIFEVQSMMLQDADFHTLVRQEIDKGQGVEAALHRAAARMAKQFEGMSDPYLRERAADVMDVSNYVIEQLRGGTDSVVSHLSQPGILCAYDLSPAQTAHLDRERVLGFVTAHGSPTSHTAILARSMGIPAVVGVGEAAISAIVHGMTVAIDAAQGVCYLAPEDATVQQLRQKQGTLENAQHRRERYRGRPTLTANGRQLHLYANAALPTDVEGVLAADAEGIGLFRSEFLYLGREEPPDEQEQYEIYKDILTQMQGRRVIVRTLDIGADKQAACLPGQRKEENPALGCRAVRHSLLHPSLFLTQARALLRAARHGKLAVMFPLISSEQELRGMLSLWERAKSEVQNSMPVELGIMIETPAAALISDRLATYNVSENGRTIYCQIDNGTANGLYEYDIDSNTLTLITAGDYNYLNLTTNYLFYQTFDQSKLYVLNLASGATSEWEWQK